VGRPPHPLLSRDRIVSTALALADSEGLEAVSTRRLAAELGVAGPSLYNHVGTKEELLDDMVDAVLARVDTSMFAKLSTTNPDWRAALEKWARTPEHRAGAGHRAGPPPQRVADCRCSVRWTCVGGVAAPRGGQRRRRDALLRARLGARVVRLSFPRGCGGLRQQIPPSRWCPPARLAAATGRSESVRRGPAGSARRA
jgi:AcrR family transcriptional regulator